MWKLNASAAAAAVVVSAFWPQAGLSQTTAPTRQELNPAARTQAAPPQADLLGPPGAGPCPLAVNPAPLSVSSVTLRGLESTPASTVQRSYADLLNRKGDASDLCRIRDRVAEALFDRGLLARVEIPPQTINGGAVVLDVIEAHIENVVVRGDPGPAGPAVEQFAARLRGMAPFDVNKVQRYILLASDIPGLRIRPSIRPGRSGARGAVDLDLDVERNVEDLTLNIQNLQARATGRWGGLARYDFNAHTAWGQQTSLVGYRTVGRRDEQWVVQGLEEARLGGEGWVARGAVAYGESRPGDVLKPLGLRSTSLVATFEGAYPLVRKRRENLSVAGGFELVNQQTSLPGGARLIDDSLRVLYLRASGDRTFYAWGGKPTVVRTELGVRRGFEAFGSSHRGDRLLSRAEARPGAWLATADTDVLTVLSPRLRFHGVVNAQYANQPLAAYQEYAVGSLSVGRGYDPGYASGDSAVAGSAELHAGPFQPVAGVVFGAYAFFDAARVWNRDTGSTAETLTSTGFGLQAPVRERWILDVGYARPLDKRTFDTKRPSGRVLVNLTARFF